MSGNLGYPLVIFIWLVSFLAMPCASDNRPADKDISKLFPLTLIHINDLHARFEETNMKSNACTQKDQCIAGIARVYHKIKELLQEYKDRNAIYLNAGDNFQGTLWYNLLRWEVTADFITKLKPVAMTLGNHEFDHTPKGLAPYLAALDKAGIPTIVANLVTNGDPDLKNSKILKSLKMEIGGKKIGIIGVMYDKTHEIAQTGKVTLSNAVEAVRREATSLKKDGVDIIVVLSHCSYDEDKKIAAEAGEDIDVIVGAHSHSFLYSPDSKQPFDAKDKIEGPYPTIVESKNKRKIPIVQAKSFGKYVGRLTLYFDDNGEVKHWEGYPVFIDNKVKQDPQILKNLEPWRKKVEKIGSTVVGETTIELDRDTCRDRECTLGVLYADGFADHYTNNTFRPFAIIQAGNFRNPIKVGKITNGDIIEAAPFGSTADLIRLKGADLWDVAEHSFALDDENRTNCLQVSGLRIVIDPSKAVGSRVVKIDVKDNSNPKSGELKPLDKETQYYIAVPSYLADGKDGFSAMKKSTARWTGPLDSDVFKNYVEKIKKVVKLDLGRVILCKQGSKCNS
ncbi:apyrase-like [Armigeres subalbatus]|uniref:apyrase-like n=1 Tax=Armigeres subalbatus TaxID=124917 RepID=UPI002ED28BE3